MTSPIANTFGAVYIGVVLAALLYGITIIQTFFYYQRYGNQDRWSTQILVLVIFILDTVHLGVIVYSIWYYLIQSFGSPEKLLGVAWPMFAELVITVTIVALVQCFHAWRIHVLMKKTLVPLFIMLCSLLQFGFGLAFMLGIAGGERVWTDIPHYTWSTDVAISIKVIGDITIAVAMWITLRNFRSEFANTRAVVNELTVFAVGVGVLTTLVSILTLSFLASSTGLLSTMFYVLLTKVYANSILVSLNTRHRMRDLLTRNDLSILDTSFRLGSLAFAPHVSTMGDPSPQQGLGMGRFTGETYIEAHIPKDMEMSQDITRLEDPSCSQFGTVSTAAQPVSILRETGED